MRKIDGVYLSGWEYNRLLDADPCKSGRNSALPGDILWNGSAQLWLFEKVYCTAEALENEREDGKRLKWTTGNIFSELASDRDRWFVPVDWSQLSDSTCADINARRNELARDADVLGWIASKNVAELETRKALLLEPILAAKDAVLGVSPSSLRHWQLPSEATIDADQLLRGRFYSSIEKPLVEHTAGLRVCRKPRATPDQVWVTDQIEAPHINNLVAGEGDFAGRGGYVNYHKLLEPHKQRYAENDEALWSDWQQSRERLKRLREVARKYLWDDLHRNWLPTLLQEREPFLEEFQKWISSALRMKPLAELFDIDSRMVVGVAGASAATVTTLLGQFANIDVPSTYAGAVGALAATEAHIRLTRSRHTVGSLALFYQKAG